MTTPAARSTRDIARSAVRAELAQVAFELFLRDGFGQVTINDLAAAAGVSRSTFLRYFASKEEPVLGSIDEQGGRVVEALRARPAAEDDWTALRAALEVLIDEYRLDPAAALALSQLIYANPALCAGSRERQAAWRPALARGLVERVQAGPRPVPVSAAAELTAKVRAAAAVDCLSMASEQWSIAGGDLDLGELLDQAFAALGPGIAVPAGPARAEP